MIFRRFCMPYSPPTDFLNWLAQAIRRGDTPPWLLPDHPLQHPDHRTFFCDVFNSQNPASAEAFLALAPVDPPPCSAEFLTHCLETAPFALPAASFVFSAEQTLKAFLENHQNHPLFPSLKSCALAEWRAFVLGRCAQMCRQTLALEFGIARLDTPDLEWEDYAKTITKPDVITTLFAQYPVLAEQLQKFAAQQARVMQRFLRRLLEDFAGLPLNGSSQITGLSFGEGDLHNGGQSVVILSFDKAKLVYKPRDMRIEKAFNSALAHLNTQLINVHYRTLTIHIRDGYGWVEFVSPTACKTLEDVRHFYRAEGGLIAILHLIGGFDFHRENLIASGPDPVIVDLETLFYTTPEMSFLGRDDPFKDAIKYPAVHQLFNSVVTTLLLPQNARNEGFSGIAGDEMRHNVVKVFDTKTNQVSRAPDAGVAFQNQPRLHGKRVSPAAHLEDISAGYNELYEHFLSHRDMYAAPDSPLGAIAQHTARAVLRDTDGFVTLLDESFHPTLLQSRAARAAHFLNLWPQITAKPGSAPLFAEDFRQLWNGDVPYYAYKPRQAQISRPDGTPTGFSFEKSGYARYLKRLTSLSPADKTLQSWIIRTSLEQADVTALAPYVPSKAPPNTSAAMALETTHQHLMQFALKGSEYLDWLSFTAAADDSLIIAPVDLSLYAGISGIALYLAHYAAHTTQPNDLKNAQAAYANMAAQVADDGPALTAAGAFDGHGGIAYTLIHLAALWQQPELISQALKELEIAHTLVENTNAFDIISGSAGLVLVAMAGYEHNKDRRFLDHALRFSAHLRGLQRADENGPYWATEDNARALTGFSHGQSGVMLAFARILKHVNDPPLETLLHNLIDRENMDFSPQSNNWIDWRWVNQGDEGAQEATEHYWCNGSAGIALTRACLLDTELTHPALEADLHAATLATLEGGCGHNLSLCHGDLGNLDILSHAMHHLDNKAITAKISTQYRRVFQEVAQGRFPGGLGQSVTPMGLMVGMAGIGYGLLRHLSADQVPDVLSLSAPIQG